MNKIGDFLISLLYVAGIFVLVRPGSQGPSLVQAITSGTASLIDSATGDVSTGTAWAAGMSSSSNAGGSGSGAGGGGGGYGGGN
jgi:hypothetical protein